MSAVELVLRRAVATVLPIDAVAGGLADGSINSRWHNDCGGVNEHGRWWSRSGVLTITIDGSEPVEFSRGLVAQAIHVAVSADERLPPLLTLWTTLRAEQAALMGEWDPAQGRFPISDHARYGALDRALFDLRHNAQQIYGTRAATILTSAIRPTTANDDTAPSLFDQEITP